MSDLVRPFLPAVVSGSRGRAVIVMGVAGSGKTTVSEALAARLHWRFIEGDGFHSDSNIAKLRAGTPLSDDDRRPWLRRIAAVISGCLDSGECCVVACSSLKREYRQILSEDDDAIRFVFLRAPVRLLEERLLARVGHLVDARILPAQLATLEEPTDALSVDASLPVPVIVSAIVDDLAKP